MIAFCFVDTVEKITEIELEQKLRTAVLRRATPDAAGRMEREGRGMRSYPLENLLVDELLNAEQLSGGSVDKPSAARTLRNWKYAVVRSLAPTIDRLT